MLAQIFKLLGSLAMFLYGMNLMSTGIQKASGNKLRSMLGAMTSNPFKGVLTGLGITSIIQSSSATTVLVVSFVSAGLLSLSQAIGVIMGANIGTTVTAWIISLFGFKFDIAALSIPFFLFGFILSQMKKDRLEHIGEFIIGFSLLFLGLSLIKSFVPDLKETPEVLSFIQNWSNFGFGSILIAVLFGTILTLVLQSSSATMAITLIMLDQQWISFDMGAAMVLGENIGTTITANVAATMGNTESRRAAIAHTIFNVFGVIWALILFRPFLALDRGIVSLFGEFNPLTGLAMFHTLFNTINTMILIWFIPKIESLARKIVPSKIVKRKKRPEHLNYITAGPVATPELGAQQALLETIHFAEITQREIGMIGDAVLCMDSDEFEDSRAKLVKYEEITDKIEHEIASFLTSLIENETSQQTSMLAKALFRIISELESIGDSGECISRILSRLKESGEQLSPERKEGIARMLVALIKAYTSMLGNLKRIDGDFKDADISGAIENEQAINKLRDELRDQEFARIEAGHGPYANSTLYIDVIAELERMGDYLINISQAVQRANA
ncbi:MAG: Na/Pi cotransporter family protein [Bacteroidales bacterium]|nr:Na/Pi cotransporter family protein [Bacteroidales bacterium]